jgi:hypothetical protein
MTAPSSGAGPSLLDEAEPQLLAALRAGRRDDVVQLLLDLPERRRRRLRTRARWFDELVSTSPFLSRSPGAWDGILSDGHQSAAVAAVLGCSTLAQAVKYHPLDMPDARDLPKAFFPEHLQAFSDEWSARFLRSPKAWDRIRGIEAQYDWAHEGLIPAPVHPGAVLFLVTRGPGYLDGPEFIRYLEARPVLIDVTLRRIFDVDGVKGASLAQRDETTGQGSRMDDFVIPELIRRGRWSVEFVKDGIDRALARGQTPYLTRWFAGLAAQLACVGR